MRDYDTILGVSAPDEWKVDAACLGADPNLFFPEHGYPNGSTAEAYRLCHSCTVTAECLEYVLTISTRHSDSGIWGGTNAKQRREMKRRRP